MKTLIYIGKNNRHGYAEYVEDMETADLFGNYVDIDFSSDIFHPTGLHTTTKQFGEADCPVHFDFEVIRTPESVAYEIKNRVLDNLINLTDWTYGNKLCNEILLDVAKDVLERADVEWNVTDVCHAIGRVLLKKLGIE